MDIEYLANLTDQEKLQHLRKEYEDLGKIGKSAIDMPAEIPSYEYLESISENIILAELNISVLSKKINDDNFAENTQVYSNTYWIPVPSGNNVKEYISSFIQHTEKSLGGSK